MTSLQTRIKQIAANDGYYINIGDARTKVYQNNGTDAAPSFGQVVSSISTLGPAVSTLLVTAGNAIFRDHGKTLVSSGRVFRKVQLLVSTGVAGIGSEGVAGVDTAAATGTSTGNYLTMYLELPGLGGISSGNTASTYSPVARLG